MLNLCKSEFWPILVKRAKTERQLYASSHNIPAAGLFGESQIFAVNKKMSVARQSAGTLKTLFKLKGE
jgi:hypothetical protein